MISEVLRLVRAVFRGVRTTSLSIFDFHKCGALLAVTFVFFPVQINCLAASPPNLRGNLGIHDPSNVIKCNGRYYVFGTGQGIISRSSADKQYWVTGPNVFATQPAWTTTAVPGFTGFFWAPNVVFFNNQYYLYYAVSTFGSQVSAIGLATNPTLDPSDPNYQWTDQGPVIQSGSAVTFNAIDPSVAFDTSSNLWMSFGSYWAGIELIQLDPATGKRLTPASTVYPLAYNSSIEASCLYSHGGYYYLFVNWGTCCSGVNSTYNIRVGRSANVTGPYLDRNGVNMLLEGGTLFLKTTGKYIGPGQTGILDEDGTNCFGYHYYDGNANGAPTFDFEPLAWTSDGWPAFTNDWSAAYRFQSDARDDNGQYYGLMQNGAGVRFDPVLGGVLNLNGATQFVVLPDGLANALTVSAVFKWNGGAAWQRVFDFGRGAGSYAFLTSQSSGGKIRFGITSSGNTHEQDVDAPGAAPAGAWTQAAVTTDGTRGILYVNGAPVATNNSMTLTLPDIAPTNTWFGRSQFAADPYFNGQISSIRVYGRALAAAEISAPQPLLSAPATGSHYQPGGTVRFAGSATDFADSPLSVTSLTWTVEFHDTNSTSVVLGPLSGIGGGSFTLPSSGEESTNGFHRIVLSATDTLGRTGTNCVDVSPGPPDTNWTAFYPFDNGAADANGNFNGTLAAGNTTSSDPVRGSVLNFDGSHQYVALAPGIGAMRTFGAWVNWYGGGTWERVFDFGASTNSYAMLTTRANTGALRFEITPNGEVEARDLDAPNPLPINTWTHVAVAIDGRQAVMFVNGQAVAVNASVNLLPSDVAGAANYLGRSQFSDPLYYGQMDSVQIASRTMTVEEITASSLGITNGPSGLILNWPAWTNGLVLHGTTNLGGGAWVTMTNAPSATNGVNFLTVLPTNSQQYFRLQLP
jgi:hypothetical protein